jgi:hypothetical protein
MHFYRLPVSALLSSVLFGSLITAADPVTNPLAKDKPWKETFAMTLKGKERTYVVYQENSYLLVNPDDLTDPAFLHNKDVVIAAKLGRIAQGTVTFYNMPKVISTGPTELWRTRVDGDNLYVFGHFTITNGTQYLSLVAAESAPSDQQIIDQKMATIPADNLEARLAAAAWARDTGVVQGNREFWLVAADNIISQVVDDAVAKAETSKDVALILKTMGWCQDLLHDIPRAARIGSAPWIRQIGGAGAEDVAKYMRRWDLEFFAGQWLPRGEALSQDFQARFAAIGWRDAEGYYKLGRWAEANAEVLPRARELSYRAYQAGLRADPNHNGIRRELGMDAATGASSVKTQGEFKDSLTGISIPIPPGWNRADHAINGDASWIDPASDTAYITAKILRNLPNLTDFGTVWASQLASVQGKTEFTSVPEEKLAFPNGQARLMRYSYREGRYLRVAAMILAINPASTAALRLDASGADTEGETVIKQLTAQFAQISIPAANAIPNAAQTPESNDEPKGDPKNESKTGTKKPPAPTATSPRAPTTAPATPTPTPPRASVPQGEADN